MVRLFAIPLYIQQSIALACVWLVFNILCFRSWRFWQESVLDKKYGRFAALAIQLFSLLLLPICIKHVWLHAAVLFSYCAINSVVLWFDSAAKPRANLDIDLRVAWAVTLFSSWLYSLVSILLDSMRSKTSGLYFLSDCWKTLAVVLFSKKVQSSLHASTQDDLYALDERLAKSVESLLPKVFAYILLASFFWGYAMGMGSWVAYEIASVCSIIACPCVISCLRPFLSLAAQAEKNAYKLCQKQQGIVLAARALQNLSFVCCYYAVSLFLGGGGSLLMFKSVLRPWQGGLLMLAAQMGLFINTNLRPLTVPRSWFKGFLLSAQVCKQTKLAKENAPRAKTKGICPGRRSSLKV